MPQLRVIKKYPNRRLYDTEISSYVTLEDVRQLIVTVIRFYGDSLQGIVGSYLEKSIQLFSDQQTQLRGTLGNVVQAPWTLISQLADKNMEIWKGVQQGIKSGLAAGSEGKPEDAPPAPRPAPRAHRRKIR